MQKAARIIIVCVAGILPATFDFAVPAGARAEQGPSYDLQYDASTNAQTRAGIMTRVADVTEGGRLDTDFNAAWLSEWWYLNGKVRLTPPAGATKDLAFFVVVGHQESADWLAWPLKLSHLFHFCGLYFEDGTPPFFFYTDRLVPRRRIANFIALRTPYLNFRYPSEAGRVRFSGSGLFGYRLVYRPADTGLAMNLTFRPKGGKTVDQSDRPLLFNTYERALGTLRGSISLGGTEYRIRDGEAYFDHMIPRSLDEIWTRDYHGWNWFEVTTDTHQAVFYGTRNLEEGYGSYAFRHLTLLERATGKVAAEYFGDDLHIVETAWEDWPRQDPWCSRPTAVEVSTADGTTLHMNAEMVNVFDARREHPVLGPIGFVDFMAYQPDRSTIQYKGGEVEHGNSFFEYLVAVPRPD